MPASKAAIELADKRAREAARLKKLGYGSKEIGIRLGLSNHSNVVKLLARAEKLKEKL
jgi:DNA-binding CsgD family transcriptional regulator